MRLAVAMGVLALAGLARADTSVLWNYDLTTTGQNVFYNSTTAIDNFAPEYDYVHTITSLQVKVLYLFITWGPFDVTDQIPREQRVVSGTVWGPPPMTLIDQFIYYPEPPEPLSIAAQITVWIDAAGFGHASITDVFLGTVQIDLGPPFGVVTAQLKEVRVIGNVAMKAIMPGDVDRNGKVDQADLAALLACYGTCAGDGSYDPAADVDGSGCVDQADLAALLSNYGYGV